MFLTRSKTSSAINEEHFKCVERDNSESYPVIPDEMLSILEDAVPSIESALDPLLPNDAKEMMLAMISSWIISSRIAANNSRSIGKSAGNKQVKQNTLRLWATRSFSLKQKPLVAPLQCNEISDKGATDGNNDNLQLNQPQQQQHNSPCLTESSHSTALTDDASSLYTPLIEDVMPNKKSFYQLPVSLKSMIDLLDTPPLIPDGSSLSLIEESITPLSSAFFDGHDHLMNSPSSAAGAMTFKTASENNQSQSGITTITSSRDARSIGHSISTIFTQLGYSVKKAFKKKSQSASINQLKKTFSVQNHLSSRKEKPIVSPSSAAKAARRSYSTVISTRSDTVSSKVELAEDRFSTEATITTLTTSDVILEEPSEREDHTSNKRRSQYTKSANSFEKAIHSSYWDGDSTQSQQFDKLLDDIWERSQEYQDYFTAQEEKKAHAAEGKPLPSFQETWSPSTNIVKASTVLRESRTEGNMNNAKDIIPYVCVGKQQPNQRISVVKPSKDLLDIEDIKAYKRSTSAYSNIKDYDIDWQLSFHEERKSREKVANTLKSVSWAFYEMIKKNHSLDQFDCDAVFDENECSVSEMESYTHFSEPLTEWSDIYDQMAYVFDCGELTAEHAIITFIYAERMLKLSKQKLWDFSWRMIIMSSLLTAVKVWDDCAIFNADFAMIFPELSLDVINNIERVFLTYLEWDVSVDCSEFAKTYFYLRNIEHTVEQW